MLRTRRFIDLLICFAFVGMLTSPAWAKFTHRVNVEAMQDGTAYVVVNGRKAIHLRTRNGTLSPVDRAKIASGRLAEHVKKGIDPKTIWCRRAARKAYVMVGDSMLVIATANEARTRRMSTKELADMWVRNLQKLLSLPPLSADPTSVVVPLGETRAVAVESLLPEPVTVEVSNPLVIAIDVKAKPGSIVIMGGSVGDATVTIRCKEHSVPVSVSVKKYAAYAALEVRKAVVTGWNAPASLASLAARDAARQAVALEPGAQIRAVKVQSELQSLSPGQTLGTSVQVEAAGGDHIPAKLLVQIEVENRPVADVPTSWLMYSNDPERVSKYRMLFAGRMDSAGQAVRLLYHHQNMMRRRIGFVIDVVNASNSPASLHVMEGVSQPMVDTVAVGYKAGLEFLQNHRNRIGRVIDLPAGTRRVLVSQPLDHRRTASGIMELRQLSGDPLLVRVIAKPEGQRVSEDPLHSVIPATWIDPSKIALSDHIYPEPVKDLAVTYTAGKAWVFLRIGKHHLKHATRDMQLYGNYGVTYNIKATLENPGAEPLAAELAFEATAGPASGVFVVDGEVVRVKYLKPPAEVTIRKVIVPPGRSRAVSIRTIPLSGSAYPATLIIREAGTTASKAN